MSDARDTAKTVGGTEKLLALTDEAIKRLNADSERHKNAYRRIQKAIIILTATTTVAAGAGLILPEARNVIQFVVLALAATTTAVTSWGEMMRSRELWRHERQLFWSLSDVRREIDFYRATRGLSDEEVENYFRQVSSLLGSSVDRWGGIQDNKGK